MQLWYVICHNRACTYYRESIYSKSYPWTIMPPLSYNYIWIPLRKILATALYPDTRTALIHWSPSRHRSRAKSMSRIPDTRTALVHGPPSRHRSRAKSMSRITSWFRPIDLLLTFQHLNLLCLTNVNWKHLSSFPQTCREHGVSTWFGTFLMFVVAHIWKYW